MENYAVRFMALIVTIMLKNYVQYAQLEIISGEEKNSSPIGLINP